MQWAGLWGSLNGLLLSPVGTVDVGKARLMFWDLGGQEELQSLWDKVSPLCCFPPGATLVPVPLFSEGLRITSFPFCQQLLSPLSS